MNLINTKLYKKSKLRLKYITLRKLQLKEISQGKTYAKKITLVKRRPKNSTQYVELSSKYYTNNNRLMEKY